MFSKKVFAAVLAVLILSVGAAWAGDDEDRVYSGADSPYTVHATISQTGGTLPVRSAAEVKDGYPISLRGALMLVSIDDNIWKLDDGTGSVFVLIPVGEWSGSGAVADVYGVVGRSAADGDTVIYARHVSLYDNR